MCGCKMNKNLAEFERFEGMLKSTLFGVNHQFLDYFAQFTIFLIAEYTKYRNFIVPDQ